MTVPSRRSAPGLARARGRARDVEHVVQELEGQAHPPAERAERLGIARAARRLERPEPAGRLEQARRLELAAAKVALEGHLGVERVGALQQLALG